jgi:Zn-dependent protease
MLPWELYATVLVHMILMNIGLGLFNLLPIPPLDGSHVLENLLPPAASLRYRAFARFGPFLLLGIIMLDNFAHTRILDRVLVYPMVSLAHLFAGNDLFRLLRLL